MSAIDTQAEVVLAAFRTGKDTLDISKSMNLPEPTVSRLLWVARCRERALPATYLNKAREMKQIAPAA